MRYCMDNKQFHFFSMWYKWFDNGKLRIVKKIYSLENVLIKNLHETAFTKIRRTLHIKQNYLSA